MEGQATSASTAMPDPFTDVDRVRTSHIVLARFIAAVLNVAPPLVGSYALGRASYGMVASVLAIATIVFGPIGICLNQNLLRLLCTAQTAERTVGAALLYCTACAMAMAVAYLAGAVSMADALQLTTLVVSLTLLRICEVQLISAGRVVSSIIVFFAAPPLLSSAAFLVAASMGGGPAAGAAAQSIAYCVAAALAIHTSKGVRSLLVHAMGTSARSVARELAASSSLMASGAAAAAAEFLPVVLLRGLGAFSVIPVFEIARKIASVPTTLANPLLNQMSPAIIRAHASKNRHEIRRLLQRVCQRLSYAGIAFFCLVAATLIAGSFIPRVEDVAELLFPLSIGTAVAMWCVPYQSLLIAARGDHWFSISSGVSVALLLAITHMGSALGPGPAVSWAVACSVAASGLIVRYRAMKEA